MHGGAPGSGAPRGNKNALRHGLYTREALTQRRKLRELMRQSREVIAKIREHGVGEAALVDLACKAVRCLIANCLFLARCAGSGLSSRSACSNPKYARSRANPALSRGVSFIRCRRQAHGPRRRRGSPAPPLARKTGRGRAGGPIRQPHRPARPGDRAPQSALVRTQYRPGPHRGPTPRAASGRALDGRYPRRHGRGHRGGFRSEIHAAMVVLRRGGGRKAYGPAAAQYVGHQCQALGALHHHRRRQMGRDQHLGRPALSAPSADRGEEVLALRRERRAPSPLRCRAAATADRGHPDCRYERLQFLGGVCRPCSAPPARPSSTTRRPRPN